MATSVSICSNALVMLGGKPFASFDEPKDNVRTAAVLYASVRDDVLRLHSWNCATKRELLAPLVTPPVFDFTQQFSLPGDWIRTLQVGYEGDPIPYRSEGQRILASVTVLPLVYVYRNDIEATWSANLIHVVELAMAAKMAYSVTASASLRDSLRDEYARELKVAKAIDGQDDPPEEFMSGTFVESRFS
ncbi:hypothetical protein [Janthinobacterium sp. CG_S6]|uniref:hypothetical protein n=1 Tax=Janthinobacterium sp. CG_S6 TaxID=3071707 RepID=UPI002DFEEF3F|nr:hypothetical protein [Janthinobacterium sp. CG_S6]